MIENVRVMFVYSKLIIGNKIWAFEDTYIAMDFRFHFKIAGT
jgi:hypothetical protein